jgi:pimeloyl-ACP methyl ester carboxylesterase
MKKIYQFFSPVVVRAGLLLLVSLQAASAQAQSESTPPPFPPPGKLVDIGGWRLHLNCTGEARASQPTVILEAGKGDFSVEWSLVQPGVAKFARVCSYDRGGDGWSDLGPYPRTMHQIVYELHTLLDKAGVKPPLVFVGHSYGGGLVRLYASTYPADVAGMTFVEGGDDNPRRKLPDGKVVRAADIPTGRPIPAVKVSNPLRVSDIPLVALSQMRAGMDEAVKTANDPPRNKLPADAQRMRTWALAQLGHVVAADDPFELEELAGLRAERAKSECPLDDRPLIVLTRGIPERDDSKAFAAEHRRDHASLAKMSRNGKLIIAARSGHHIQLDEPELVIKSIREVLEAALK